MNWFERLEGWEQRQLAAQRERDAAEAKRLASENAARHAANAAAAAAGREWPLPSEIHGDVVRFNFAGRLIDVPLRLTRWSGGTNRKPVDNGVCREYDLPLVDREEPRPPTPAPPSAAPSLNEPELEPAPEAELEPSPPASTAQSAPAPKPEPAAAPDARPSPASAASPPPGVEPSETGALTASNGIRPATRPTPAETAVAAPVEPHPAPASTTPSSPSPAAPRARNLGGHVAASAVRRKPALPLHRQFPVTAPAPAGEGAEMVRPVYADQVDGTTGASARPSVPAEGDAGGGAPPPGPPAQGSGDGDLPDLRPVEFSDDHVGELLSENLGADWRYVPEADQWYEWDGQRWAERHAVRVLEASKGICRAVGNECDDKRVARSVSSKSTIYAAERLARMRDRHVTPVAAFDAHPYYLNTPGGIAVLNSGLVGPHNRDVLMTRMTAAAPSDEPPRRWLAFLNEATGGDQALQRYLQKLAGYCLSGDTREQGIFFIFGQSGTGKSVFIHVVLTMLGDYGWAGPMDLFVATHGERHPVELAALHGRRLVTASETEEGRRWDEAKLKRLTGGDRISARFMRGNFFEFEPTFKLLFAGNYRPTMRSADSAMRRRFRLIPFTHQPARDDKDLRQKLRAELGGITRWALDGSVMYWTEGLAPPPAVEEATNEYFRAEDPIGRWIEERCKCGPAETMLTRDGYRDYQQWAPVVGEYVGPERWFAQRLEQRGFGRWKHPATRQRGFHGVGLLLKELPLDLRGGLREGVEHAGSAPDGGDGWET